MYIHEDEPLSYFCHSPPYLQALKQSLAHSRWSSHIRSVIQKNEWMNKCKLRLGVYSVGSVNLVDVFQEVSDVVSAFI